MAMCETKHASKNGLQRCWSLLFYADRRRCTERARQRYTRNANGFTDDAELRTYCAGHLFRRKQYIMCSISTNITSEATSSVGIFNYEYT